MKKVLSLILTLTLLISMVCIGTIGASANDLSKTYDAAADGDRRLVREADREYYSAESD